MSSPSTVRATPLRLLMRSSMARVAAVTVATGVGAGLAGMLLALLLHAIQHVAYGYSLDALVDTQTFLQGVSAASPQRRIAVMALCGALAGFGWWALRRFGAPLVSVKKAAASSAARMPARSTLVHVLLQIATVAMGSPLGREVAPREAGALVASWLSEVAQLSPRETRLMIACGAGAGLAAVYNVPLGGAVFVLEVMLGSFSASAAAAALAASALAAVVARIGLGNELQYAIPAFNVSRGLLMFALVAGPVLGIAAYGFKWLTDRASAAAPRGGWSMPLLGVLNFATIGVLAVYFPQLLGNGKSVVQLGFGNELTLGLAAALLGLRVLITASSLRVGAHGGLLTPGLAVGALLGVVLGGAASLSGSGIPSGAFALIGAAAFLASSMNMPLTAIVLIAEFTHVAHPVLVPVVLAVAGSVAANRLCASFARGPQAAAAQGRQTGQATARG
jgi:H+/Cl- antiporter ClcA